MVGPHFRIAGERWEVKSEAAFARVEQIAGLTVGSFAGPAPNLTTATYNMRAWYLEGAYRAWEYGEDRWLKLVARFDDVDTNDKAAFTPFDRSRFTLGLEWQYAPRARLRYEFQKHTIDDYEKAPPPIANSVPKHPGMHMVSVIFWF